MKKHNNFLRIFRPLLLGVLAAGFVACTADMLEMDGGKQLSDKPGTPTGALYSTRSSAIETNIKLFTAGETITETLVYKLSAPVDQSVKVTIEALNWDLQTCEAWNQVNGDEKYPWSEQDGYSLRKKGAGYPNNPENYTRPYPASQLTLSNNGEMTIVAGETASTALSITIPTTEMVEISDYVIPLKVTSVSGIVPTVKEQTIYLQVRFRASPERPVYGADPYLTVFANLDVSRNKPELACCHWFNLLNITNGGMDMEDLGMFRLVDVVNLQQAEVKYDKASGRVLFTPTNDLRYVLTHDKEMLGKVRAAGITVGIVIQGGKAGIGFCNMTDAQISDFAAQVKLFCTQYQIGSITLWDKNSNYEREGMPAVNTTSYPKLIKALREALKQDALLNVVDQGDPTATFYDPTLCGNIEVGKLIDYAWEGRMDTFTNPWNADSDRKPFAGLDPKKYTGNYFGSIVENVTSEEFLIEYMTWQTELGGAPSLAVFELVGFIHGNESASMVVPGLLPLIGFGADLMGTGEGMQGMPDSDGSIGEWGGYSNNYYDKDWD